MRPAVAMLPLAATNPQFNFSQAPVVISVRVAAN